MNGYETYMRRCLQLAALGAGHVAPNPVVGAVLVHEGRIIGEGYHRRYGEAHAEVNCLAAVPECDRALLPESTLYVSLEPCAHWGKTPPCADLVLANRIPYVVVGCRDPFPLVDGKGIEKLRAAGVEVSIDVLREDCVALNRRFFTFHTQRRPYVVLKWAQSADGMMAAAGPHRAFISNAYSNRLVHKWRSEEAAILVGTNTAMLDDPQLNARLWPGPDPVRLVVDAGLRLPASLKLFDGSVPTVVFNKHKHSLPFESVSPAALSGLHHYQIAEDASLVHQLLNGLYRLGIQSVLVEGGARLLQSFVDEGAWDEARVIANEALTLGAGLPAPQLSNHRLLRTERLQDDAVRYYESKQ